MEVMTARAASVIVKSGGEAIKQSDLSSLLDSEKCKLFSYIQYQAAQGNSYIIYKNNLPMIEDQIIELLVSLEYKVSKLSNAVYSVSWFDLTE